MPDLAVVCNQLKRLATQPENPDARAIVEEAFNSKWEGVKVTAAKTFAAWGGRRSVELLKSWVYQCYLDENFGLRIKAEKLLAQCIEDQDADWVLDFYFDNQLFKDYRFAFWPILHKISFSVVRERLQTESQSEDRDKREAVMYFLIGLGQKEVTGNILKEFNKDPDPTIRSFARAHF